MTDSEEPEQRNFRFGQAESHLNSSSLEVRLGTIQKDVDWIRRAIEEETEGRPYRNLAHNRGKSHEIHEIAEKLLAVFRSDESKMWTVQDLSEEIDLQVDELVVALQTLENFEWIQRIEPSYSELEVVS